MDVDRHPEGDQRRSIKDSWEDQRGRTKNRSKEDKRW